MSSLRILFADDQIPDEEIPDEEISSVLKERHPLWAPGSIKACVLMRETVKALRGAGYDVTVANSFGSAKTLISEQNFDIAIIDLGWGADEELPRSMRDYAGWDLCRHIDQIDTGIGDRYTLQIIFSDRFLKDASISMQAADNGKLPIFKNYKNPSAGRESLKAAVKFIEGNLAETSDVVRLFHQWGIELRRRILKAYDESLHREKLWSYLTMGFIAVSLAILLVGIISAFISSTQISVITSAASIVSGFVSTLFLTQLRRSQELNKENVERIERYLNESLEQFNMLSVSKD